MRKTTGSLTHGVTLKAPQIQPACAFMMVSGAFWRFIFMVLLRPFMGWIKVMHVTTCIVEVWTPKVNFRKNVIFWDSFGTPHFDHLFGLELQNCQGCFSSSWSLLYLLTTLQQYYEIMSSITASKYLLNCKTPGSVTEKEQLYYEKNSGFFCIGIRGLARPCVISHKAWPRAKRGTAFSTPKDRAVIFT